MKTIIMILIILVSPAAYGMDISVEYAKQVPISDNFGDFDGVKITASPDDSILYGWLSGEHGRLTLASQQFSYVDLIGAGVGIRKRFDGFELFADVGWFEPLCKFNDYVFAHGEDGFDRLWLHLEQAYGQIDPVFDYYKMHVSGNFGGSFGVKYFYKFRNFLKRYVDSFYGLAGYRILSLPMIVEAWWKDNPNGWNRFENESLTGPFVGIGITF